jgi:hypothetical protein
MRPPALIAAPMIGDTPDSHLPRYWQRRVIGWVLLDVDAETVLRRLTPEEMAMAEAVTTRRAQLATPPDDTPEEPDPTDPPEAYAIRRWRPHPDVMADPFADPDDAPATETAERSDRGGDSGRARDDGGGRVLVGPWQRWIEVSA